MKIIYRGPCEELHGQEIEVEDHDCREHLRYRTAYSEETHGLDCGPYEQSTDEWWECVKCGTRFTAEEMSEAA